MGCLKNNGCIHQCCTLSATAWRNLFVSPSQSGKKESYCQRSKQIQRMSEMGAKSSIISSQKMERTHKDQVNIRLTMALITQAQVHSQPYCFSLNSSIQCILSHRGVCAKNSLLVKGPKSVQVRSRVSLSWSITNTAAISTIKLLHLQKSCLHR